MLSINPHPETRLRSDHFLGTMPEGACPYGGRGRFDPLLPKESGLLASPQTGTTGQEVINGAWRKPGRVRNLRLPGRNSRGGLFDGAVERGSKSGIPGANNETRENPRGGRQS